MKKLSEQETFLVKIQHTIDTRHLLEDGGRLLVGVSGGPDSMCLLHALQALSLRRGYRLEAAHVNHLLRGSEAASDQQFVSGYCKENRIPFHTCAVDVKKYAREHSAGIEESARILRYQFLNDCAETLCASDGAQPGAVKIAVAHHLRDQAETVLMNLIRGCGTDGLKGMDYRAGNVIRPLLNCSKEEIDAYIAAFGIPYCVDRTNQESCADRNRIRLELIPLINELFGRNAEAAVEKTRRLCSQDADFLNETANRVFEALWDNGSLSCRELTDLHPAIFSRVARALFETVKGDKKDLSLKQTESILRIASGGKDGARVDLSNGYCAAVFEGRLFVLRNDEFKAGEAEKAEKREEAAAVCVPFEVPSRIDDKNLGTRITTRFAEETTKISIENLKKVDYNSMTWYFPYENVCGSVWRFRREGDRIRPNRRSGGKPLKKYLIDIKFPREKRDRLLLLARGSEVLWIPEIQKRQPGSPADFDPEQSGSSDGKPEKMVMIEVEFRS